MYANFNSLAWIDVCQEHSHSWRTLTVADWRSGEMSHLRCQIWHHRCVIPPDLYSGNINVLQVWLCSWHTSIHARELKIGIKIKNYILVIHDVKNDRGPKGKFQAIFGQVLGNFQSSFRQNLVTMWGWYYMPLTIPNYIYFTHNYVKRPLQKCLA